MTDVPLTTAVFVSRIRLPSNVALTVKMAEPPGGTLTLEGEVVTLTPFNCES